MLKAAAARMNAARCWVTYYGKMFDIPFLNTRLLRWEMEPLTKKPHLDLYFTLRSAILTGRRSQGHLLSFLQLPEQKMGVSATVWSEITADPKKHMPTMARRCNRDTAGLRALYKKTRHLIREISR